MQSLGWYNRFVLAAGIAAPLAAMIPAALTMSLLGHDPVLNAFFFLTGHALGNLVFTPIAMVLTGRRRQRETWHLLTRRFPDVVGSSMSLVAVCSVVFAQRSMPLLFLPVMVIILATFRLGRVGAAIGVLVLACVGGAMTALGNGPIQLLALGAPGKLLFFQFYIAATVLTVIPVSADLHHRRATHRRLKISEERFRLIAEHSSDLLMHIDADGTFRYVSPSIRQVAGYDHAELVGRSSRELIDSDHLPAVQAHHQQTMDAGGDTVRFDYLGVLADGSRRWFETYSRLMLDEEGRPDGVMSIARDIHDRKLREVQLSAAASTDSLTGLPNRRAFTARVAERLGESGQDCIAVFDLDHFKRINDTYGHDVGDAVLREFARLARRALRRRDMLARLGGEEFVALFPDSTVEQVMHVCERMRVALSTLPIEADGHRVTVTVSGGVARIGEGGLDAALKVADAALYRAKRGGRDRLALAA